MSFIKNNTLRERIRARGAELVPLYVLGDPPITKVLAKEFMHALGSKSEAAAYQMVCYYLRTKNNMGVRGDARRVYTAAQLKQLSIMSPKDREAYAEQSGKSVRAVNAAVERYRAKSSKVALAPIAVKFANEDIIKRNYFDFCSPTELKAMGVTPNQVYQARLVLSDPYGLSLRSPNILYHAPTRRRYHMSTSEQLALLESPIKFIRSRAEHIKDRWVTSDRDPVDDEDTRESAQKRNYHSGKYDGYPLTADGAIDLTQLRRKMSGTMKQAQTLEKRIGADAAIVDSETYTAKALVSLRDAINTYLERCFAVAAPTKPFGPKDPTTYVDDTNQTRNTPQDDYSDVDDWAADWKPVSA